MKLYGIAYIGHSNFFAKFETCNFNGLEVTTWVFKYPMGFNGIQFYIKNAYDILRESIVF